MDGLMGADDAVVVSAASARTAKLTLCDLPARADTGAASAGIASGRQRAWSRSCESMLRVSGVEFAACALDG